MFHPTYTHKLWLLLFYLRVSFHQLVSPPGFHVTHIPKGSLVYICVCGSYLRVAAQSVASRSFRRVRARSFVDPALTALALDSFRSSIRLTSAACELFVFDTIRHYSVLFTTIRHHRSEVVIMSTSLTYYTGFFSCLRKPKKVEYFDVSSSGNAFWRGTDVNCLLVRETAHGSSSFSPERFVLPV